MKAEELMIGDWVYGCTDPYNPDEEQKKYPVKVIRIDADGDTMTEGENPFTEPYEDEWWNLEPIPLTQEILEKNGFHYNDLPFVQSWEQFGLSLHLGGNGYRINCGQNVAMVIDSVHQLQHVLRLCGIEKEIVI